MKITGSVVVPHPAEAVWDAILDPSVLVVAIPGCSRLEEVAPHSYAMTVTAGVASIRGVYDGSAVLSDLEQPSSLTMRLTGAGSPGTIDATVAVAFREVDGGTAVSYDADAVVGGMVGGVGQRMLSSVSKRMAAEFFTRVGEAISGAPAPAPLQETGGRAASAGVPGGRAASADVPGGRAVSADVPGGRAASASERVETPRVFTPPARPGGGDDFVKGIAVGAGLVLLGVLAGRLLGRQG